LIKQDVIQKLDITYSMIFRKQLATLTASQKILVQLIPVNLWTPLGKLLTLPEALTSQEESPTRCCYNGIRNGNGYLCW